jgi:archaellum component FlaD/FlaE
MIAGSEGVWLYAIIGIASLIYKVWKKGQESKKEKDDGQSSSSSNSSFGFDDLISQFEKKYNVQEEVSEKSTVTKNKAVKEQNMEIEKTAPPIANNFEKETPYYSESLNTRTKAKNKNIIEIEEELEFDLEKMIVAKTILERPNF